MATDIDLEWGKDIVVSPTGDISLVSGAQKVRQRVLRRFLTTRQEVDGQGRVTVVAEYIWHRDYGGSARHMVDNAVSRSTIGPEIQQSLTAQAKMEAEVTPDPRPVVTVTIIPNGVSVDAAVAIRDGVVVSIPNTRIKTS